MSKHCWENFLDTLCLIDYVAQVLVSQGADTLKRQTVESLKSGRPKQRSIRCTGLDWRRLAIHHMGGDVWRLVMDQYQLFKIDTISVF